MANSRRAKVHKDKTSPNDKERSYVTKIRRGEEPGKGCQGGCLGSLIRVAAIRASMGTRYTLEEENQVLQVVL